ncbi:MAG: hypothetical protein JNN03_00910 [Rubrivivax sp.]|nr:hypothetical protein [Rubrivivax sp.]
MEALGTPPQAAHEEETPQTPAPSRDWPALMDARLRLAMTVFAHGCPAEPEEARDYIGQKVQWLAREFDLREWSERHFGQARDPEKTAASVLALMALASSFGRAVTDANPGARLQQ